MNRTLVLVKPDGMARKLTGSIISTLEQAGLEIVDIKKLQASKELLYKHYHKEDDWFESVGNKVLGVYRENDLDPNEALGTDNPIETGKQLQSWLVDFMASEPIIAMVVQGDDAVGNVRRLCGATIPAKADPSSIRGKYAHDTGKNAALEKRPVLNLVHASGEPDEAEFEIGLWFPHLAQ